MSSSRFFNFFASDRGRNFALGTTVAAAMGSALINFIPHTFFVDKHRDLTSSYKYFSFLLNLMVNLIIFLFLCSNGVLRQTPETIRKKYDLALELLKVSDFDRNFLKPYMVFGFDTYSIGSTKFKYGALTGIPTNYMYTSPNDIERGEITIRGQKVNWSSEGGKNLEHALVLTDDEQVFGIAREIIQLQTQKVLLNSIFPCASIVGVYTMAHALNTKLLLLQRPFSVRGFLYVIVGLFGYGVYCLMADLTQVRYDSTTDEILANLGEGITCHCIL